MPSHLLTRLTPPAEEPVTLADLKLFLRIDQSAEDALLVSMLAAARHLAEEWTGKSFVSQTWRYETAVDAMPLSLPRGPVVSIASVSAVASNGGVTALGATAYHLQAGMLMWDVLPGTDRARIDYATGYGAASAVPQAIRQAVLMQAAWMHDRRDGEDWCPQALALLAPYREVRV